jgi:putative transposase
MRKEELLSDDFLKQFKTEEELYGFLAQLQKRGIEKDARRRIRCSFRL